MSGTYARWTRPHIYLFRFDLDSPVYVFLQGEGNGDHNPAGEQGDGDQNPAGEQGDGEQNQAGEQGDGEQNPAQHAYSLQTVFDLETDKEKQDSPDGLAKSPSCLLLANRNCSQRGVQAKTKPVIGLHVISPLPGGKFVSSDEEEAEEESNVNDEDYLGLGEDDHLANDLDYIISDTE